MPLRRSLLGIAAVGLMTLGAFSQARAGLLVAVTTAGPGPLTPGTNFFYAAGFGAGSAPVTVGAYNGILFSATTNYPGGYPVGTLTTSVLVSSLTTALTTAPAITVMTTVLNDVSGLTLAPINGFFQQYTALADLAILNDSSNIAEFTTPHGAPYTITADVGGAGGNGTTSGNVVGTTSVDGLNQNSGLLDIVNATEVIQARGDVPGLPITGKYNMAQTLVISNTNVGATSLNYTIKSTVSVVPEPSTVVMGAMAGVAGLALTVRRKLGAKLTV